MGKYGWGTARLRWCTSKLKIDVTRKYLSKFKEPYTLYIGIAFDEPKRHENIPDNVIHPLYDWCLTEKEALEYCYSKGFDFGGVYNIFKRVSCYCCPLKQISEVRKLKENFPELFKKLQYLNEIARSSKHPLFRLDYSLEELEKRFEIEDREGKIYKRFPKHKLKE